ncbi:ABC-type glycerol-3-phosphate transport system permease component [Arthrobacter pascens]|uniref:carbohydrate ABC transporter permease n=1 Tax=Arthrobacter pascens TaxID=1677 RepID=UPI002864CF5D|nr:carbohydrate ABC transporter permease [Arthrobacter pascens]MDR6557664.1 ABC-type glycerol-3-phosphate transport system permease component [Arthrobacter pascens]
MRQRRWTVFALYGILTLASIIWLVPVVTAAMISILPLDQSGTGWWRADLSTATLENYGRAWQQGLSTYTLNSFIISISSVALTVVLGTSAAYAFARMKFRLKGLLYFLLITTMIVPVQIILIPLVPWFRTLNLNEGPAQFLGIALVHTAFGAGWALFMLIGFFSQIPEEVLESARLDGASEFQAFRRIALPLAVPGIVSFIIIDFVFVWNDLLMGLTLLDSDHRPLTVGLANLQAPQLNQDDLISSGSILAIIPPLLLFALLNRYYVRGLYAGAVKG